MVGDLGQVYFHRALLTELDHCDFREIGDSQLEGLGFRH